MRCFVISGIGYPSDTQPYRGGFIHSRIKAYAARGVKCQVFTTNRGVEATDYVHDGVPVAVGDFERCVDLVKKQNPDRDPCAFPFYVYGFFGVSRKYPRSSGYMGSKHSLGDDGCTIFPSIIL